MACKIFDDLGTVNIAAKHKSLLEDLSIEEIIEEDPDYIFVVTMGNSEKAIQALKDGIEKNPAWSGLSAVKMIVILYFLKTCSTTNLMQDGVKAMNLLQKFFIQINSNKKKIIRTAKAITFLL